MEDWIQWWHKFKEGSKAKFLIKTIKYAFLIGIIFYIIYQLKAIGIREVLNNLPLNPLFYVLFIFLYLSLPLWEIVIYKLFWNFRFREGLRPFISKKIFNSEVVGYSGEIYLFTWAKKKFNLPNKELYGPIKDNSILSSVVSTITAIVLLVIYAHSTDVDFLQTIRLSRNMLIGIISAIVIIVIALFFFRKNVLSINPSLIWKVLMLHEVRILCTYTIEVFQWSIIMPEVPFTVWFTFLAVKIITSRLPFIPNQDIIFAGLGIELSKMLNVSSAGIAGILLTNTALTKMTNLVLYSIFQIKNQIANQK